TAALGGHAYRCDGCGHEEISYNSCRNRHGPKCLGSQTAGWLRREASYLLPVPYYHVVFTRPEAVATRLWQNRRVGYGLRFRAAVLPAGAGRERGRPAQVPGLGEAGAGGGAVVVLRGVGQAGRAGRVRLLAGGAVPSGVGGVRQGSVRRSGAGAEVPGGVHAPG